MGTYDHLIGKKVIAKAKRFTFVGTLRHAQEVAIPDALEVVTNDGTVDFGGLPQAFDSIQALDIDLLIAENAELRNELMDVRGDKAALQRKVDTHECVPTQWAYDQACKALHEHRSRADAAEAKSEDDQRHIRILRQQITDLRAQARAAENDLRDLRERAAETAYHDLSTENAEMADKIRALPLIVDTP